MELKLEDNSKITSALQFSPIANVTSENLELVVLTSIFFIETEVEFPLIFKSCLIFPFCEQLSFDILCSCLVSLDIVSVS